jgi:flagellar motor switch/type III secretory pathway protein FliN
MSKNYEDIFMNVTLKEIVNAREALTNLGQQKLPVKISYGISKIIRHANKHLNELTETKNSIVKHLVPEGTEVTEEITQEINTQMNEALNVIVEIPVYKIDLSNISSLELTSRDIIALEPFCIFETVQLSMT